MFDGWLPREGTTDQRIIDHVYVENGYEVEDDMTGQYVIDIGANIGTFSRLCAERGASVQAYEPYPESYALLVQHTKGLRVNALPWGLGPTFGSTKLWINESNMGGHSITNKVGDEYITVNTVPLKAILTDFPCDVLKLDCEGAEVYAFADILNGLHACITEIVVEIHEPDFETKMSWIHELEHYYIAHNIFQADWRLTHL